MVQVGAGGAGRAVAFALMDLGIADLILYDLDRARADALKSQLASQYGTSRCRVATSLGTEILELYVDDWLCTFDSNWTGRNKYGECAAAGYPAAFIAAAGHIN